MSPQSKAALEAGGCEYISADAGSSEEQQITDVENLISRGCGRGDHPGSEHASDQARGDRQPRMQGIPVIAYDRLIEDANTFYVSFDNVLVGQLMAEVIFDQVPTGQLHHRQGQRLRRQLRLPA